MAAEMLSPSVHEPVTCPCCGGQFPGFQPFGQVPRPNARCPLCGSKKRHRLLWLYLRDRTHLFTDRLRVLHFAPEKWFRKAFKALPNLDYVTADLHPGKVMLAIDITAIPPSVGTFDVVLCSHVLEHVPDDRRAMREVFRVLRPGGRAIFMIPAEADRAETFEDPRAVTPEERERLFKQHDHVRIYGRDFGQRLEQAGFIVSAERYAEELGEEAITKYGLKRRHEIYSCARPAPGARDAIGNLTAV